MQVAPTRKLFPVLRLLVSPFRNAIPNFWFILIALCPVVTSHWVVANDLTFNPVHVLDDQQNQSSDLSSTILASGTFGMSFFTQYSSTGFKEFNPLIGVDVLYNLRNLVHIGPFYEKNFLTELSGQRNGNLQFIGLHTRVRAAPVDDSNLFLNLKLGWCDLSTSETSSGLGLGFGVGTTYMWKILPRLSLAFYIGYRMLKVNIKNPILPLHDITPSLSIVVEL